MLHLITGQISHRIRNPRQPRHLRHLSATESESRLPSSLVDDDDFLLLTSKENEQFCRFGTSLIHILRDPVRLACKPSDCENSLLDEMRVQMPSWTPDVGDKICYATVREAHASSRDEIATYLGDLKQDLCIGAEGFQSWVVLAGDQQLFAIIRNLKTKHPSCFDWAYPVPGDWHFMKTLAEVLKAVLWDGGLCQLAAKCGMKKKRCN